MTLLAIWAVAQRGGLQIEGEESEAVGDRGKRAVYKPDTCKGTAVEMCWAC